MRMAVILTVGALAWAASNGHAAEKKGLLKLCSDCCGGSSKTVEVKAPTDSCVHTTCCPKPCEKCAEPVCMGTTTKKKPSRGPCWDWLTYRPSSNCCGKGIQVLPCRYPPLHAWFAHRCCHCDYAGTVDSPCCDEGCDKGCSSCKGCAAKPSETAKAPGLLKPAVKKLARKDQFASDVAQPVHYQPKEGAGAVVVPAKQ